MKGFEWLIAKPEKRNYGSLSIIISFIFAIISLVFIIFGNNRIVAFYIGVSLISLLISFLVINKWIFSRLVNIAIIVALLIIACVTAYFMVPLIDREYDWSRNIEIEKILAFAQYKERYGESDDALTAYESILEISAKNIPALYGKARMLENIGEVMESDRTYYDIISQKLDLSFVLYESILVSSSSLETKLLLLNKLISEDSTNSQYFRERAKTYNQLQEYEAAIDDFRKAIEYSNGSSGIEDLQIDLGDAYANNGNDDYAILYYKLGPSYIGDKEYYDRIASFFYRTKDYKNSEQYYYYALKAIKEDSDLVDLYINRAKNFLAQDDNKSALDNFNFAIKAEEDFPSDTPNSLISALKERAKYFQDNEDNEKAINDYSRIIESCISNPDQYSRYISNAYLQRGKIFSEGESLDNAISDYTEGMKFSPQYKQAFYHFRGIAHMEKREYKDALDDLNNAIRQKPSDFKYESYYERARLYFNTDKLELALLDIDLAIKYKRNPNYFLLRAEIYDKIGDPFKAFNDANTFFNYCENNPNSEYEKDKNKAVAIMSKK